MNNKLDDNMYFAQQFRRIRKHPLVSLTQKDFAALLGWSTQIVKNIEKGKKKYYASSLDTLVFILREKKRLTINKHWFLFGGEGEPLGEIDTEKLNTVPALIEEIKNLTQALQLFTEMFRTFSTQKPT